MKKILIITTGLLFITVFSGCASLTEKKTISISNQSSVDSIQNTEDNASQQSIVTSNQNTENSEQKTENNSQQSSVSSHQEEEADNKENDSAKIVEKFVSWGFEKSAGRKIDTIIIHSSYDAIGSEPFSVSGLINEYKQYGVAAHYLIDRDGKIYHLVADKDIAYHAGESKMEDGRNNVNEFSIGIELMNTKIGQMTDEQYQALNWLIQDIKSRYEIKYVLGHNQVASNRKDDPWNINWDKVNK